MDLDAFCNDIVPDFAPLGGNRPDCAVAMSAVVSLLEDPRQQQQQQQSSPSLLLLPPDVLDTAMAMVCAQPRITIRSALGLTSVVVGQHQNHHDRLPVAHLSVYYAWNGRRISLPYHPDGCFLALWAEVFHRVGLYDAAVYCRYRLVYCGRELAYPARFSQWNHRNDQQQQQQEQQSHKNEALNTLFVLEPRF